MKNLNPDKFIGYRHKANGFGALLLLILFVCLTAFQDNQKINGTWTGTDFHFKQFKGPDISEMIKGGRDLHVGGQLILNDDGNYQIKDPYGMINGQGTWHMENQHAFTTIDESGESTTYEIRSIGPEELITVHQVAMETPEGMVEGDITLIYNK